MLVDEVDTKARLPAGKKREQNRGKQQVWRGLYLYRQETGEFREKPDGRGI